MARPSTDNKQGAVRKRQQIQDSSKAMFLWVAGMSVIVGFALVVSYFLWNQIDFKHKIIDKKNQTVSTLEQNNKAVIELRDNIRVLETSTALNSAKANDDDKALQVILDALPSDVNSLALGASVQKVLASGVSGLSINTISITPSGSEQLGAEEMVGGPLAEDTSNTIMFRMVAESSNVNRLKELLERFEKSIRVIDIDNLRLERNQARYTLTLDAHAYYQPARNIELTNEVVRP